MSEIYEHSQAALYGKGVFTTIAIRDGQPFLWDKHWRRLTENAARMGIDLSGFPGPGVRDRLNEALTGSAANGRARITFLDGSPSPVWPIDGVSEVSMHILTGSLRTVPDPLRLAASPHLINSTSPLAGIKSCNYLEHLIACDEARRRGFDEAVRMNERGAVASACMANVFWLKDDRLYTPSLRTGCLAGTTREFVLENFECDEVEQGIEQLRGADAAFLTSTGLGVVRVAEFDGRELQGKDHPILQAVEHPHTRSGT